MNFWTWLALLVLLAGGYVYLNYDWDIDEVLKADKYCTEYYARTSGEDYIIGYDERVDAIAHGCIE